MSWRCAWCWRWNGATKPACANCGRDIEAVEAPPRTAGRPRIADMEWDGVVLHNTPGVRGYRDHKCRCPQCLEAMEDTWAGDRERKRFKKKVGMA